MILTIRPQSAPLPDLSGRAFDPDACDFVRAHPGAAISDYPWDESGYRPEARAHMARSDAGLRVLMWAREATVSVRTTAFGGEVWKDSCLECFLQPFADDSRYINIEVNAAGAALIGMGPGRAGRALLMDLPEGMGLTASRFDGACWAVAYTIPRALIEALYRRPFLMDAAMRGNFYKCDESIHPHFGAWNPVVSPTPDFHRPECFGTFAFG